MLKLMHISNCFFFMSLLCLLCVDADVQVVEATSAQAVAEAAGKAILDDDSAFF